MNVLGVNIDPVGQWEAMRIITRRLANGEQTAVFTPNPIMVHRATREKAFLDTLNRGDLNVADGIGLVLGARIMRLPPLPRVAGIELGERVLCYAAEANLRVFLLGGKPQVAETAAKKLCQRFPGLTVCGTHHGYFPQVDNDKVCQLIKDSRADVVLVCLGSPRQEIWIDENRKNLDDIKLFMGLGGSLDVWSGNTARAPHFASRMGGEWLWRMAREPKRLSGLGPIAAFLHASVRERIKKKKQHV